MDEPGGARARTGPEIVLLDERDRQSAERSVARDARPDDPAADDEEIDGAVAERPHRLLACSYLFALLYLSIWSFMSATAASSAAWDVACPSRTDSIIFWVRARACGITPSTQPLVERFCGELRIWLVAVRNCGYLADQSLLGPSL